MPTSGSGEGTPIIIDPLVETIYDQYEELTETPNCAVSLSRYAKLIKYDETSFWGIVNNDPNLITCGPLWSERDRIQIGLALAQAQQQIETLLGYPLCPTWVTGTVDESYLHDNRWVDQQWYRSRLLTKFPRLIAAGIRATEDLEEDAPIVYGDRVGTITITSVTFTDPREVIVTYPDSDRRIIPSKVSIAGGTLTIEIPRFRMVVPTLLTTPEEGIDYSDLASFLSAVDVTRVYNDPSRQAVLVRPHCSNGNCSGGCGECTHDGCIYILDHEIGHIDVRPALWNEDTLSWDSRTVCASNYRLVRLNYLCGMRYLNAQAEEAIVTLAHTKLHGPPCSCDWLHEVWKHHNAVPRMLTRERLNCPFGVSEGAWRAYVFARSLASVRASIL